MSSGTYTNPLNYEIKFKFLIRYLKFTDKIKSENKKMKYYKFKKIKKGRNPIIRITYKNFWGSLIDRDICKCSYSNNYWVFMDTGELILNVDSINTFYNNDEDIYYVND